ncbi:MAG: hypothetical protein ACRDNZ_20560 [Streptosporangiaceae bacterium]
MTKPITPIPSAEAALAQMDGRLFASVTEVSVIFNYDRRGRTLRRGIEAGAVPAIKAGDTYRIPVAWVREQLRIGADGGPTAA